MSIAINSSELASILRIRQIREDSAVQELTRAKSRLVESRELLSRREQEDVSAALKFRESCDREFQAVDKRIVTNWELRDVAANIRVMKRTRAAVRQKFDQAQNDLASRKIEAAEARKVLNARQLECLKIKECLDPLREEDTRANERLQDLEMEDFRTGFTKGNENGIGNERDGWNPFVNADGKIVFRA